MQLTRTGWGLLVKSVVEWLGLAGPEICATGEMSETVAKTDLVKYFSEGVFVVPVVSSRGWGTER